MSIADKLTRIAENEQKVYDAGYEAGRADADDSEEAYNQGVEDGKKAEHDAFWDSYQLNGTRKSYQLAFVGATGDDVGGWTDITFRPKHDIVIGGDKLYDCDMMFQYSKVVDLKGILERNDVRLDFSKAQRLHSTFDRSSIRNFPEIDLSSCTLMQLTFQNCLMKDLTLLNIQDTCEFNRTFNGCSYLENLTLTGTIGQNGFNVSGCRGLNKASITSIINALSGTATGKTVTLSEVAVIRELIYKQNVTLPAKPNDEGYYKVGLPFDPIGNRYLFFFAPMDVRIWGGRYSEEIEDYVYEIVSEQSGVRKTFIGDSSDYDGSYYVEIKRTDGKELSEADVVAVDYEDLGSEWDTIVASKPNWNIVLA